MNILVTLQSSGSEVSVAAVPGTLLPSFLQESPLALTNLDFQQSSIFVNDVKVLSNDSAALKALNDGDVVYVGKVHTNG